MRSLLIILIFISGCGKKTDDNSITASGTIEAINVTVSSKVTGQIKRIIIREGDKVRAGDLLMEIDHDLLDIQLRQAEASVDFAYAQLHLLQSGARREDIRTSQEQVKQAKINLELAAAERDRISDLYKKGAVTEQQYQEANAHYEVSAAQYNSARENLKKIQSVIRPEEIESANANLKKAAANADALRKNIQDCSISAPVDGIISKKFVEEGENVNPNSSLLRISNLERVELAIYVPEKELGRIKQGQNADITVDAFKDKTFGGKVIYISPEAEFTPKNIQTPEERTKLVFEVKIQIPNQKYELKPGMPADARINLTP